MSICSNRSKNREESAFDGFVQCDAFRAEGESGGPGSTESSGGHFSPRKLSRRNAGGQCRRGGLAHPGSDVPNGMSAGQRALILHCPASRREKATSCWLPA